MGSNTGKALKVVNDLGELLSQLLAVDVAKLPAAAQLQCLQALRPVACQVEAVQLRLVGAIDERGTTRARGSASTAAWLRNVLRVENAAGMVKSAAALSALPKVSAAFAAGEIGNAHVATIARVVEAVPTDVLTGGMEDVLVAQARQLPPSKFAPVASRIRDQAVPPAAKPRAPSRKEPARWLRTDRSPEGNVSLTGMFDGAHGELLLESLTSATARPVAGDAQDLAVRRADALLDLCRRATTGRAHRDATSSAPAGTHQPSRVKKGSTEPDVSPAIGGGAGDPSTREPSVAASPGPRTLLKSGRVPRRQGRRKRHRHSSLKR